MNVIDGEMHLLGIRPEHVSIDGSAALRGRVVSIESSGADRFVHASTPRGEIVLRLPSDRPQPAIGEEAGIAFDDARIRRFDRSTGKLLT